MAYSCRYLHTYSGRVHHLIRSVSCQRWYSLGFLGVQSALVGPVLPDSDCQRSNMYFTLKCRISSLMRRRVRHAKLTRNPGLPSFPSKPSIPGGPFHSQRAHECVQVIHVWEQVKHRQHEELCLYHQSRWPGWARRSRRSLGALRSIAALWKAVSFNTKARLKMIISGICTHFFTFEPWRTISSSFARNTGLTLKTNSPNYSGQHQSVRHLENALHTSGPGNPGGPGKPLKDKRKLIISPRWYALMRSIQVISIS